MAAYRNDTGKALYVNADKSKVVPEDSPEAAFVLVGENGEVPDAEAKKYGLGEYAKGYKAPEPMEGQPVPSTAADPEPEPKAGKGPAADADDEGAKAESKAMPKAESKAVQPKENK